MRRCRSSSYGHRWVRIGGGYYRLEWSFDVKLKGSRLRHPRTMTRDTDLAGAVRFARKWDLAPPAPLLVDQPLGPQA